MLSTDAAGVAVEEQKVTVPSGHVVTLIRFDAGRVVFDLHIGSTDPPVNLATIPGDRGPAIAADEAPFLLAAFNGGFKIRDGPGGVELQGQVVAPLSDGKASFVIDVNGTAHVGVWGSGLPLPGEQVASVRQNLAPLITNGVPNPTVNDPTAWGATLTSSKVVPRSAAGEAAQGNIIYSGRVGRPPVGPVGRIARRRRGQRHAAGHQSRVGAARRRGVLGRTAGRADPGRTARPTSTWRAGQLTSSR